MTEGVEWRFDKMMLRLLEKAGWSPGRNVWGQFPLPAQLQPFPLARQILSEFGMLEIRDTTWSLVLDPNLADRVMPAILRFIEIVQRPLYPLGAFEVQDTERLVIDDRGCCYWIDYAFGLQSRSLKFYLNDKDESFDAAITNCLVATSKWAPKPWHLSQGYVPRAPRKWKVVMPMCDLHW